MISVLVFCVLLKAFVRFCRLYNPIFYWSLCQQRTMTSQESSWGRHKVQKVSMSIHLAFRNRSVIIYGFFIILTICNREYEKTHLQNLLRLSSPVLNGKRKSCASRNLNSLGLHDDRFVPLAPAPLTFILGGGRYGKIFIAIIVHQHQLKFLCHFYSLSINYCQCDILSYPNHGSWCFRRIWLF
jgi:hypothetical protein